MTDTDPTPDPVATSTGFLRRWHAFVADWTAAGADDRDRLVRAALAGELVGEPADEPPVPDRAVAEECAVAVVTASGLFDTTTYLDRHPEIGEKGHDPVLHYCRRGWQVLRNPSLDFDGWWYWAHYLDPADDRVDPFLHYLLVGRHAGLPGLPPSEDRAPTVLPTDRTIRRACLFAAYDVDGVVDATVVDYVRELSRFADVHYLAACRMEPGELDKLAPYTVGAWAVPHDAYDFGSYSMLARDLVGWDALEEYDEVLLVNDSCYLLRPLDELFATMAQRPGDWWGLQITARHFDGEGPERAVVPDIVTRADLLPRAVADYDDFLHVGSYFLALRRPVVADPGFRRRLDRVAPQRTKINLIYKYETGTTQYLLRRGFHLALLVEDLLPYHPVYGPGAFELIARGLPFLKRGFLAENPYDTPDLADWRARVSAAADVDPERLAAADAHLHRVSPQDRLHRSFAVRTRPDGTVDVPTVRTGPAAHQLDRRTEQRDDWWAFPVCAYTDTFAGNERAVFEEVRHDPSITKVVLTRSRAIDVDGANVHVVPLMSPEGQELVTRCRTIFVKHGPRINVPYPLSPQRHDFINLWHGIPLKRFGLAAVDLGPSYDRVVREHERARAVIVSSKLDRLAMSAAFKPLAPSQMWLTGLPRNDYILRDPEGLPSDLAAQEARLRAELGGRRLVLFLPTFKQGQADSYHHFDEAQVRWLRDWAERHDAVLGIREHMADRAHVYSRALASLEPLDLSARRYPDLEILYRAADALVTDYSSCVIDFLLTGRPVISFAYDLDRYAGQERGLFYRLEDVLPGPVCRDFEQLSAGLDDLFRERTEVERDEYDWKRRLFFEHVDDGSAARVVEQVRALRLDRP